MKIVHIGNFRLGTPHGLFNAIWAVAKAQSALGHDVVIVRLGHKAEPADIEKAERHGIALTSYPSAQWRGFSRDHDGRLATLMASLKPDIVHLQYVRVPKYLAVARYLASQGTPFAVSTHGGLNPTEMTRHRLRKFAYWMAIERRVHKLASGVHFLTQSEKEDYLRLARTDPLTVVLPNPVEPPPSDIRWLGSREGRVRRLVFLGRYDIWTKGLDLAAQLVHHLNLSGNQTELHLYGSPGRFEKPFKELLAEFSDVVIFDHGFVGGRKKYEEMSRADLYIQYSRFEAFGLAMVEAIACGVPTLVSSASALSGELDEAGAAYVIPMDPALAAAHVARLLHDRKLLHALSQSGAEWAKRTCDPNVVADGMVRFYQECIATNKRTHQP